MQPNDIFREGVDEERASQIKRQYGHYYKNLISVDGTHLSVIEKENPDLTKPFRLYSSRIALSTHERLNLMERETVKALLKKTAKHDD